MPPADNTRFLIKAARNRSQQARTRAELAISAAQRSHTRPSVADIARTAKVSRSWLYTQADLMQALRQLQAQAPAPTKPAGRGASAESLRQRLQAALARNAELRAANTELTRLLEVAHGEIRRLSR
jgi:hypothetical protein